MRSKPGRWVWGMVAFWGVIGAVLTVVAVSQPPSAPEEPAVPVTEAGLRTVVISTSAPAQPSSVEGPVEVALLRGEVGETPTVATVLTDENCAPDEHGYSHCLNRLQMPGGERIAVRHTHRMDEVPCLYPGERVNVEAA